jgi:hypothetical protein
VVGQPDPLVPASAGPYTKPRTPGSPSSAHNKLTLRGAAVRDGLVSDVTAFIVRSTGATEPEAYVRFPQQPIDPGLLTSAFGGFGLPNALANGLSMCGTTPSRSLGQRASKRTNS